MKPTVDTKNTAQVSFYVSNLLAKLKPFSDGEFVKEYMDIVVENIYPKKDHSLPIYHWLGGQ